MSKVKDVRYKTVRNLIAGGFLTTFREIFENVPKTTVAKDLGINNVRFSRLMYKVEDFMLSDLFRLAGLIETEEKNILDIVIKQYLEDKNARAIIHLLLWLAGIAAIYRIFYSFNPLLVNVSSVALVQNLFSW